MNKRDRLNLQELRAWHDGEVSRLIDLAKLKMEVSATLTVKGFADRIPQARDLLDRATFHLAAVELLDLAITGG